MRVDQGRKGPKYFRDKKCLARQEPYVAVEEREEPALIVTPDVR